MSTFFEDTMRGLLEAMEIEKGNVPLTERKGMPAPTFYVADEDREIIDKLVQMHKIENFSSKESAEVTSSSKQITSYFA